jgi:hypothetical protein
LTVALLAAAVGSTQEAVPKLGKDPIPKVVAAMTLEEKAYFVTGRGAALDGHVILQPD